MERKEQHEQCSGGNNVTRVMNTNGNDENLNEELIPRAEDVVQEEKEQDEDDNQLDRSVNELQDSTICDNMIVNVKFIRQDTITLICPSNISIELLKSKIWQEYLSIRSTDMAQTVESSASHRSVRLIYKGKLLKDEKTLDFYQFSSGDTIHAVESQPPQDLRNEEQSSSEASASPSTHTFFSTATSSGLRDMGNGVMYGEININANSAMDDLPDIGGMIQSMLSSLPRPTTQSAPRTTSNASSGTEQINEHPVSNSNYTNSMSLQSFASRIRRQLPPLELTPLSRPADLSLELYALGNAIRESSDTFLAVHRQLQFVSQRLLQENHLNATERRLLRGRIRTLIPLLREASSLGISVSNSLSSSSYGHTTSASATTTPTPPTAAFSWEPFNMMAEGLATQSNAAASSTGTEDGPIARLLLNFYEEEGQSGEIPNDFSQEQLILPMVVYFRRHFQQVFPENDNTEAKVRWVYLAVQEIFEIMQPGLSEESVNGDYEDILGIYLKRFLAICSDRDQDIQVTIRQLRMLGKRICIWFFSGLNNFSKERIARAVQLVAQLPKNSLSNGALRIMEQIIKLLKEYVSSMAYTISEQLQSEVHSRNTTTQESVD